MAVAAFGIWSLQFWGCVLFHVVCSMGAVVLIAPRKSPVGGAEEGTA